MTENKGLLAQGALQGDPAAPPKGDTDMASLFPRTILVGARKIYYGEGEQQVKQMIQMGSSPAAGIAMATYSILQMVGEALNESGKPTPPDLLMTPEGPAEGVIEDLSEMASAAGMGEVKQLEDEAMGLYVQQLESGGPPPEAQGQGGGLLAQAGAPPVAAPGAPAQGPSPMGGI